MDLAEILLGLRAALQEMDGVLRGLPREMEPWVLVLSCLFCGAWMVQFLERLIRISFFGWLRLLRRLWFFGRSGWCVFPGCKMRIRPRYQLCRNHFLSASRCDWKHQSNWGAKDAKSDAFYVYLLELDGGRTLYAGQTRNLMRHLYEHLSGKAKTTAGHYRNLSETVNETLCSRTAELRAWRMRHIAEEYEDIADECLVDHGPERTPG